MPSFHVVAIGRNRKKTLLEEFPTSEEAIQWAARYVRSGNAGNWNLIQVQDKRGVTLTLWQWKRNEEPNKPGAFN